MGEAGHPIEIVELHAQSLDGHGGVLESVMGTAISGLIVRGALPPELVETAVGQLTSDAMTEEWASPNKGMPGGEIRTICSAATPTFTALRGPTPESYSASAKVHAQWTDRIFEGGDPTSHIAGVFSQLFHGRPSGAPSFTSGGHWAPYNYRALDPGVQIYSHHDNHYGLSIYDAMDPRYDRSTLLSWFVTLQPAEVDGDLIIYGLWGSDPNPPMLPSRFIDTAALERDYRREVIRLDAGDMVIFDSGRHVQRVTQVRGARPRLTLGGFLTSDTERSEIAFWC